MSYIDILKGRRSVYALSDKVSLTNNEITDIVNACVVESPSAFNMQSARAVVLLDGEHEKLWEITKETLRKIVPAENFAPTETKMNMFMKAKGTILLYEDTAVIDAFKARFPTYAGNFDTFASHGNANVQINLWNAFSERGLGANLQHYNPLIDDEVSATWDIPSSWKLVAELVFGNAESLPAPKDKLKAEERVKVFGA